MAKKCAKDFKVKTQESGKYLLQDEKNKDIFCLKPDIIMRGKDRIIIVDTKWKIPDSSIDEKKYGSHRAIYIKCGRMRVNIGLECKISPCGAYLSTM